MFSSPRTAVLSGGRVKRSAALLFCAGVAISTGCDGYGRALYLREPGAPRVAWYENAKTISIATGTDVCTLTDRVASDLNLQPGPQYCRSYSGRSEKGFRFTLSVERGA